MPRMTGGLVGTRTLQPTVDFLVVTHNDAPFAEQALRSAFGQTRAARRIIVVDDGSTDGTLDVLRACATDSPVPLHLIARAHSGHIPTFRAGLDACAADWVAVFHGDDISLPNRVDLQIEAALQDRDTTLVHGEYAAVNASGVVLPEMDSAHDLPAARGACLKDLLLLKADVRSVSLLINRPAFVAAGGYRDDYSTEDWQSILTLASVGKVAHVDQQIVLRRVHRENSSTARYRKQPNFFLGQIGHPLIVDLAPPDVDSDVVGALHTGTVIQNALANANWRLALDAVRVAGRTFPRGRGILARSVCLGFASRVWRSVRPILPAKLQAQLRQLRQRWRLRRT